MTMAVKTLMLRKKINDKKRELESLISKRDELTAKVEELAFTEREIEQAINEAETDEEKETVEAAVNEFEANKSQIESEQTENAEAIENLEGEIDELENELKHESSQQRSLELARKIQWMKETEMAVVISQEQNEIKTFSAWGLDIIPHRQKMERRELDKEFKAADNPFRVVFVCAMWLTGFDVKSLSCLYLDKPLKAHTLMQTIARANRVSEGKTNGLIVDYIGIVKALRKALADYTSQKGNNGTDPTIDKVELVKKVKELISKIKAFLLEHNFNLDDLVNSSEFERIALLKIAANELCVDIKTKKEFQTIASELFRLWKYLNRDEKDLQMSRERNAISGICNELIEKRKNADTVDLMVQINAIVNEYVSTEDSGNPEAKSFDISQIDFDLLR